MTSKTWYWSLREVEEGGLVAREEDVVVWVERAAVLAGMALEEGKVALEMAWVPSVEDGEGVVVLVVEEERAQEDRRINSGPNRFELAPSRVRKNAFESPIVAPRFS